MKECLKYHLMMDMKKDKNVYCKILLAKIIRKYPLTYGKNVLYYK